MNRKQAHAIYHQLYTKKYPVMEAEVCQYCGTDVDLSIDHVPALTTAQLYATRRDVDLILVVSCMECNQLLTNDLLPLFNDRFFTLKERLSVRRSTVFASLPITESFNISCTKLYVTTGEGSLELSLYL